MNYSQNVPFYQYFFMYNLTNPVEVHHGGIVRATSLGSELICVVACV